MHITILTGASRGLGLAMAQQRLAGGHHVLAIARRATLADPAPGQLESWTADLADSAPVAQRLHDWLQTFSQTQAGRALSSVTLINNAGVVPSPAPLTQQDAAEMVHALRVGLEAPLLLTAAFLRATAGWTATRKVLLVSSGLGRRAMAGSAVYCAAKAGMDHLARALALEEAGKPGAAAVVSLAPGVIDTDMQVQLRSADAALFPERERFVGLHAQGQLDSPAQAATKVLRYLDRADFGSAPVADVRDA